MTTSARSHRAYTSGLGGEHEDYEKTEKKIKIQNKRQNYRIELGSTPVNTESSTHLFLKSFKFLNPKRRDKTKDFLTIIQD